MLKRPFTSIALVIPRGPCTFKELKTWMNAVKHVWSSIWTTSSLRLKVKLQKWAKIKSSSSRSARKTIPTSSSTSVTRWEIKVSWAKMYRFSSKNTTFVNFRTPGSSFKSLLWKVNMKGRKPIQTNTFSWITEIEWPWCTQITMRKVTDFCILIWCVIMVKSNS